MSGWPLLDGKGLGAHPGVSALVAALQARFGNDIVAVLAYGSCLRSGDPGEGLLDLYLFCGSYRRAHRHLLARLGNRLLPPNVYYAQAGVGGETVRAKVALLSLEDFRRGCTMQRFESYLWGRFAQPVALLEARDAAIRSQLEGAVCNAQLTLLRRALPLLPASGTPTTLWSAALTLSYGTELRTERVGRAEQIVAWQPDFYRRSLAAALERGLPGITLRDDHYQRAAGGESGARITWRLRRAQGKLLSLLRLLKAFFTFDGGLDYLVWKLERHSGQNIELPARVRRYPLLFAWGFFWRLYRRGIFR